MALFALRRKRALKRRKENQPFRGAIEFSITANPARLTLANATASVLPALRGQADGPTPSFSSIACRRRQRIRRRRIGVIQYRRSGSARVRRRLIGCRRARLICGTAGRIRRWSVLIRLRRWLVSGGHRLCRGAGVIVILLRRCCRRYIHRSRLNIGGRRHHIYRRRGSVIRVRISVRISVIIMRIGMIQRYPDSNSHSHAAAGSGHWSGKQHECGEADQLCR